ncbi:HET domain-containing protein [Colletotrichum kahawae]|uniref:HET domain-containing protein n=1 Tax=Colletotrichum kahawae TaxID=34407 RepID=A0AAD9YNR8_COLKA|nr:HET domain-containing protein [Colletotrichum kahawae]
MERTAHDLCMVCSRFAERLQLEAADSAAIKPGPSMPFAADLHELRQRAFDGCTLCQIFFQAILYYGEPGGGSSFMSYFHGEPVKLEFVELSDYLSEPEDEEDGFGIRAWFRRRGLLLWSTDTPLIKLDPRCPRIPSRLCSTEPGAEPSYLDEGITALAALVKGWLANCREGHAECNTAVAKQMQGQPARSDVPTRLVDVGEEGDEISLRILLNNEENPATEYTTLSYAWGGRGSDIKLTASNISEMTKAIDWARLPKTIQEAINFTRKLGVRYIWIDALCIMQSTEPDDIAAQDDWHREAEQFGRYYRNSLLTIAATGVADSAGGLFLPRPALVFQPQPLTLQRRTAEGTLTPMTIFPSMPTRLGEIHSSPLALRGWAVQERILSTRVVHFATNCVLWECGGLRATEVYPEGLHPEDESHGWLGSWMFDEFRRLDDHDVGSVLNGWYSFVEHYTRTNFTYQLDRLPARASLAEIVHERIGRDRRYLAGIWEVDISVGLSWGAWGPFLWDPPGHGKEHMGERDSVTSWSWASARGQVIFLFCQGEKWNPLLEVQS